MVCPGTKQEPLCYLHAELKKRSYTGDYGVPTLNFVAPEFLPLDENIGNPSH